MVSTMFHRNGIPATSDQLAAVAFAGFAHFTALQIRERSVRGLDLHLARLRQASEELFGTTVPDEQVRDYLAGAGEAAPKDASMSCFITQRQGEFSAPQAPVDLDVYISSVPPAEPPVGPLSLDVVTHERHLPRVKHVGEVAKTRFLRQAVDRGLDDAAFRDHDGRLSEATIWNLAFWDGETVVWPRAEALCGITMQIVSRHLGEQGLAQRRAEVRLGDLLSYSAAVVMNSWTPGVAVAQIADHQFEGDDHFVQALHRAFAAEPWTPLT